MAFGYRPPCLSMHHNCSKGHKQIGKSFCINIFCHYSTFS